MTHPSQTFGLADEDLARDALDTNEGSAAMSPSWTGEKNAAAPKTAFRSTTTVHANRDRDESAESDDNALRAHHRNHLTEAEKEQQTMVLHKMTGGGLVHMGSKKLAGLTFSAWMGDTEGYAGESIVAGADPADPTKGWGLKAVWAFGWGTIELLQHLFDFHFSKYGYAGTVADGIIEGNADAGLYLATFSYFNTLGVEKRKKEEAGGGKTSGAAGAGRNFDWKERRRKAAEAADERQQIQSGTRMRGVPSDNDIERAGNARVAAARADIVNNEFSRFL